jgi:hypothetical protein
MLEKRKLPTGEVKKFKRFHGGNEDKKLLVSFRSLLLLNLMRWGRISGAVGGLQLHPIS